MSTITINYDYLSNASKYAKNISSNMDTYSGSITNKVIRKLSSLSGSDERGYIGSASASAGKKIQELTEKSGKARNFGAELEMFVSNAQRADSNVAGNIKSTGGSYVGKRTTFQKIGDWFYNTFCVDLPNSNSIIKLMANCVKWGVDKISGAAESVKNWFKYKEGKYWWNAILAFAGGVVAIASAIVAVLTCGTVLAVVAAAAAAVSAVIAVVNGSISIIQNGKALKKYKQGELGQARYYGSIKGFSDAVEKYDMGDASINKTFEGVGNVLDGVDTACGVVITINGVANFAGVKDADGKVTKYKFTGDNIKKNILESIGFKKNGRKRYSVDSKGRRINYNGEKSGYKYTDTYEWERLKKRSDGQNKSFSQSFFGFGKTDAVFYSSENGFSKEDVRPLSEKFKQLKSWEKGAKTILDTGSVVKTNMKRIEGVYTICDDIENIFTSDDGIREVVKNWKDKGDNLLSVFDFVKPVDFVKTIISSGETLWEGTGESIKVIKMLFDNKKTQGDGA